MNLEDYKASVVFYEMKIEEHREAIKHLEEIITKLKKDYENERK